MKIETTVIEKKTRKPYTKKVKPEKEIISEIVVSKKSIKRKSEKIETYTKSGLTVLEYFDGKNLDNGNDPLDIFLKGKKIIYKTKWVIYMTNIKNHGKIMSEERASESGPSASDDFFDWKKTGKYVQPHFVIIEKKGKIVLYDDVSFIQFCDVLGKLG